MPTAAPRRVALYARVSQAVRNGDSSKSVPEQLTELHRWAERDGWRIVGEHSDQVSASRYGRKARPGWQSTLDVINSGGVDMLAVWEFSRATRDRQVSAALLAACVDAGILVSVGGKVHDPSDPDDGFMLDLMASLAVRESAMTSKRCRRNVKARAEEGRPHGSLPYGYRRVIDPETGATLGRDLHPDQAPIVAEIVRRLLAREGGNRIAADLNRRGVPTATGQQWRGGNITRLALRPTYAGRRVFHGRVLDDVAATWPPIITLAEHYALVEMLDAPERDKFRNPTHVRHLGTGLFKCGREACGGVMRVILQGEGRRDRYTCRRCHRVSRLKAPVDQFVEGVLITRLSLPDADAVLAGGGGRDASREAAANEVARLRAKLKEARQAWEDDRISLESFSAMDASLRAKIADAERRARPPALPPSIAKLAGPDAERRWRKATTEVRRAALADLVEVTLLPVGAGSRIPVGSPDSIKITWKTV